MFPFSTFEVEDILGNYLIVIGRGDAFLLAFMALVLVAAVVRIANIPQPKPHWSRK